jgi:arginine deiminase
MTQAILGVHFEIDELRKVIVCAPGRAHMRLTPTNFDDLLFDDMLWVDVAKRTISPAPSSAAAAVADTA